VLAVQPHPDGVFTAAIALPPDAFNDTLIGETIYEHAAPASVTFTALFAIVTLPLCAVVEAFAATDRFTVPGPVPFATSNPIHPDALLTIHAHPAGVVTETGLVPPEAGNPTLVDEIAYVHGTPASVTLTAAFAMLSVPARATEELFGVTVAVTVPEPVPPPTLRLIHDARLDAVQVHVGPVVTEIGTAPPPAAVDAARGETEYVQPLNVNGFERLLRDDPVGPMAATSALYVVPWTGVVVTYEDSEA
jgi:hypothetical protein